MGVASSAAVVVKVALCHVATGMIDVFADAATPLVHDGSAVFVCATGRWEYVWRN